MRLQPARVKRTVRESARGADRLESADDAHVLWEGVLTMTIFEAINHCKDRAKKCDKCGEEHRQLQEWMEELLQYREIGTIEECREAMEKQKPGLREVKDEKSKSRSE